MHKKPALPAGLLKKIVLADDVALPLIHLAALSIFVGAEKDAQNVNDLPDEEATEGKHLKQPRNDAAGVDTM